MVRPFLHYEANREGTGLGRRAWALAVTEYIRDDEHRGVLLPIDNTFRFIQAGMEVSGLMGQMPSQLDYQPTTGTELARLEQRIANTDTGANISNQGVFVQADDFTDLAAVHTFNSPALISNVAGSPMAVRAALSVSNLSSD